MRLAAATFRGLTDEYPGNNVQYRRFLVYSLDAFGSLQHMRGKLGEAEMLYREELDVLQGLVTDFDGLAQFRRERAAGNIALGRFLALTQKYDEAERVLNAALDELQELDSSGPESPLVKADLYRTHDTLARMLSSWMQPGKRDSDKALEHARLALDSDPENTVFQTTLGIVLYKQQDYKAALENLETDGDGVDWYFMAMCHHQLGDERQAADWLSKANNWMEDGRLNDPEHEHYKRLANELLGMVGS